MLNDEKNSGFGRRYVTWSVYFFLKSKFKDFSKELYCIHPNNLWNDFFYFNKTQKSLRIVASEKLITCV